MSAVCIHPWADLWVNAKGRMTCCPENRTVLGNLPGDSPAAAWNGAAAQKVRTLVFAGRYEEAGCDRECPFLRNSFAPPASEPPQGEMINPPFAPPRGDDGPYDRNLAAVRDDFAHGRSEVTSLPLFIDIQPLIRCNSSCIMCGQPHADRTRLEPAMIELLERLRPTASHFRWQGGEVFMDPDFTGYLERFDDERFPHVQRYIITNATLVTRPIAERLLRPPRPVMFLVSIDGVRAATYERIRHGLRFERAWSGLRLLAERQRGIGRSGLVVWNYVVMRSTWGEMREAIHQAAQLGVDLNFAPIQHPCDGENIFLDPGLLPGTDLLGELDALESEAGRLRTPVTGFAGMRYRLQQVMRPATP